MNLRKGIFISAILMLVINISMKFGKDLDTRICNDEDYIIEQYKVKDTYYI